MLSASSWHPRLLLAGAVLLLLATGVGGWWLGRSGAPAPVPVSAPAKAAEPAPAADLPVLPVADPKAKEERRFARADRDDDGAITRDEYLANRRRTFERLDSDGDGRLGFEEYAARGTEKFKKADQNNDGQLNPAEYASTAPKRRKKEAVGPCPAVVQEQD